MMKAEIIPQFFIGAFFRPGVNGMNSESRPLHIGRKLGKTKGKMGEIIILNSRIDEDNDRIIGV